MKAAWKQPTAYRHVVWDWNGTLLDDGWLCVDVMNGVLRSRHMPELSIDRYRDVFNFPVIDYYRALGFDFQQESFEVVGTEFIEAYEARRHEARLHTDTIAVLNHLRDAGISQSVLSAYRQETLDELIAWFGLTDYFDRLVGLQDHYAHSKIDNGVRWIAELSHRPHDVLLIGDSVHDFEVAEAMNVDCILIANGHQSRARLGACGAPVLDALSQLLS